MSLETRLAKLEATTDGAEEPGDFVVFCLGNNGRGPRPSGIYPLLEGFGVMVLGGLAPDTSGSAAVEKNGSPPRQGQEQLQREPAPSAGAPEKRIEQHITRTWKGDPLPGWYRYGQAGGKTVWVVID